MNKFLFSDVTWCAIFGFIAGLLAVEGGFAVWLYVTVLSYGFMFYVLSLPKGMRSWEISLFLARTSTFTIITGSILYFT